MNYKNINIYINAKRGARKEDILIDIIKKFPNEGLIISPTERLYPSYTNHISDKMTILHDIKNNIDHINEFVEIKKSTHKKLLIFDDAIAFKGEMCEYVSNIMNTNNNLIIIVVTQYPIIFSVNLDYIYFFREQFMSVIKKLHRYCENEMDFEKFKFIISRSNILIEKN